MAATPARSSSLSSGRGAAQSTRSRESELAATVKALMAAGQRDRARERFGELVACQQRRAVRIALHYLRDAGYRNTAGVDVSPEQIARAHRLGLTDVRHADIDGFLDETAACSVDVVLLMDVLEHLTREELFRTLDGVVRVLANGGVCIAHMPNAEGLFGMRIRYGDFTHEQAFTAQSSRQVFRAVGFSRVSCHEDKPVVHGPISFARRVIWDAGTLPYRVLLAAETGSWGAILSQNLLVRAVK